jgi:hypothetical protein
MEWRGVRGTPLGYVPTNIHNHRTLGGGLSLYTKSLVNSPNHVYPSLFPGH